MNGSHDMQRPGDTRTGDAPRRSGIRRPWLLLGGLLLLAAGRLEAQQAGANPHGTLPEGMDCSVCHTLEAWTPTKPDMEFVHGAVSGFALTGQHAELSCVSCHQELRFDGPKVQATDCASCHTDVHEGRMIEACTSCHTTESFTEVDGTAIHLQTEFPLTGAHLQVTCETCHTSGRSGAFALAGVDVDCVACHRADYDQAQVIDHAANGFPTDCVQCHTTVAFAETPTFDHESVSNGFALVGAHDLLRCATCHVLPGFDLLYPAPASQNDCVACHQTDYDREHIGSGFPTTCTTCHTVNNWDAEVEGIDHATLSGGFALVGAHATQSCTTCHVVPGYDLRFQEPTTQNDCVACHRADYDREHRNSGFPTTCTTCHTVNSWDAEVEGVDHATLSGGFELLGAHATQSCTACHSLPTYDLVFPAPAAQTDCVACHQSDYDREHAGSGFSTTCTACHTVNDWNPDVEGIDHATLSGGFELLGAHATQSCTTCHVVPGYDLLFPAPAGQTDCVTCHQADYDREHTGSGFPTTCTTCHTVNSWDADVGSIDHATLSGGFELLGAHATQSCTTCHVVPGYDLSFPAPAGQTDCVTCHQADYDREHTGSGFPTTCTTCHTVNNWDADVGSIDHATLSGGFELLGAHATQSCTTCHALPGYELLFPAPAGPSDCVTCHQGDYDREHAGSGFPTTCTTCHTVDDWGSASFDHDAEFFPIYSGAHRGRWGDCTTCHTVPGDFSSFTCLTCHGQSETDRHHSGVRNYLYDSTRCYQCHPNGRS